MELKLLNNTQKEKASDILKFYKFVYLCNVCGSIYGSDKHEKGKRCPVCEVNLKKIKKESK